MPEKNKISVNLLVDEKELWVTKQFEFLLPTQAKEILKLKIDNSHFNLKKGNPHIVITASFTLQITYLEKSSLAVKIFFRTLTLNIYHYQAPSPDKRTCLFRIMPDSSLAAAFFNYGLMIVEPRIHFTLSFYQGDTFPLDELKSQDGEIHIFSTPDGKLVLPSVGTVKIFLD